MKNISKVELHLHLDGSVRRETIKKILGNIDDKELSVLDDCKSLDDYLTKFDLPIKAMQTKENLRQIAYELVADLEKENVIYAEIRFAPLLHTKEGLSFEDIVESVLEGLNEGNIKTNLILCCMRGSSLDNNLETIKCAKKYGCAIDLAGAEAIYPTNDYKYIFDLCQSLNIPYTIHAGEASGEDSIKDALYFNTKRIGHGINYEDDFITERYIKNNITLEICPTSNIQTKVVSNIKNHPIYNLYKKGVKVTVNTDNRTVSNTNLTKEYKLLMNNFNFKIEDFIIMNIYAIEASFLKECEKQYYLDKLNKELEEVRGK